MGGIAPERDFAASVRPVLFYTDIEEFQYATHGGTAFVVIPHKATKCRLGIVARS